MKIKTLLFTLMLALALLSAVSCGDDSTRQSVYTAASTSATEKHAAPDFTVYDGEGRAFMLSDFKGKPVVLNFWASWCGPCRNEMPAFDQLYKENLGKVEFVMVNLTDGNYETVATASEFVTNSGYSFPVYFDTASEGAMAYSVQSIPTTYFIDADGNIVSYSVGSMDKQGLLKGIKDITN